jgi:tetratricopeptide (TPR) repeat protein
MTLQSKLLIWRTMIRERLEPIVSNTKFKWFTRGVWTVSIIWAVIVGVQSIPFYTAIGAGEAAYKTGNYNEAEVQFKKALTAAQSFSQTDPRRAKALNNLAELYRTQAQYSKAEPLYHAAVEEARQLGPGHEEYPLSIHNLASLQCDAGMYESAREQGLLALKIWDEQIRKPNDVKRAAILCGLGKVYRELADYKQAETLYEQALNIETRELGPNDVQLAVVMDNLGTLYREEGRSAEAEVMYKRALAIDTAALGPLHPDVATDKSNLAGLYRTIGGMDDAETLYKEALIMRKQTLGEDHPLVARCFLGLAELRLRQGRPTQAEQDLHKALEIQLKVLNPRHPDLAKTYNLLGTAYLYQHRYGEAQEALGKAYQIRHEVLACDHPDLAATLLLMAELQYKQGKPSEAQKSAQAAVDIYYHVFGLHHPLTQHALATLRATQAQPGQKAAAQTETGENPLSPAWLYRANEWNQSLKTQSGR